MEIDDSSVVGRISHLENVVSGFSVQLDAVIKGLSNLSDRINRPTNWFGLISLAAVLFGAMITFINLNLKPHKIQLDQITAQITSVYDSERRIVLLRDSLVDQKSELQYEFMEERIKELKEEINNLKAENPAIRFSSRH